MERTPKNTTDGGWLIRTKMEEEDPSEHDRWRMAHQTSQMKGPSEHDSIEDGTPQKDIWRMPIRARIFRKM